MELTMKREQVREWVEQTYGENLSQKQTTLVVDYIVTNDPEIFGPDTDGARFAWGAAVRYDEKERGV